MTVVVLVVRCMPVTVALAVMTLVALALVLWGWVA